MAQKQKNKKKFSPSFNDNDESLNYSSYRYQPKKTVAIDPNCEQLKNMSTRRYKPAVNFYNINKSSTPNKSQTYHNHAKTSKQNFSKNSNKFNSYQESESSNLDSSDDDLPMVQVVSKQLLVTKEQLVKTKNELEFLQKSFRELEISQNEVKDELNQKKIDYNNLIKDKQKLDDHVEILRNNIKVKDQMISQLKMAQISNAKSTSVSQVSPFGSMISNDQTLEDPKVACLICPKKILKNFLGFSIHFSKIHKNMDFDQRSQYSIELKDQKNSSNIPQTPKPPADLNRNTDKPLINI